MKSYLTALSAALLASVTFVTAAEPNAPQPAPSSKEFTRLKTLVGTWQGKVDIGQGPIDMTAQYRMLAAGSVLEERVFAGTPNEMITMFYEKDGKLALTHYCMMGNRPGMLLKSSDAQTLKFDFDQSCGIDPVKEAHMHALTIRFDDADTVTMGCRAIMDGKEMPDHPTTLKRVKLEAKK